MRLISLSILMVLILSLSVLAVPLSIGRVNPKPIIGPIIVLPAPPNPTPSVTNKVGYGSSNYDGCESTYPRIGSPSVYDYSEKKNIPLATIGEDGCQEINPYALEVIKRDENKPMNKNRVFAGRLNYILYHVKVNQDNFIDTFKELSEQRMKRNKENY